MRKANYIWVFCLAASAGPSQSEQFQNTSPNLKPLDRFQDCQACPEMIVMPSGDFMMGAKPGESKNPFDAYGEGATGRLREPNEMNIIASEHPRHRVEMDIPFAIARNETTYAEWMACVEGGGCRHEPDHRVLTLHGYVPLGPNHPVINVSYLDTLDMWLG